MCGRRRRFLECQPAAHAEFLRELVQSQMFHEFAIQRVAPSQRAEELLFFDWFVRVCSWCACARVRMYACGRVCS